MALSRNQGVLLSDVRRLTLHDGDHAGAVPAVPCLWHVAAEIDAVYREVLVEGGPEGASEPGARRGVAPTTARHAAHREGDAGTGVHVGRRPGVVDVGHDHAVVEGLTVGGRVCPDGPVL